MTKFFLLAMALLQCGVSQAASIVNSHDRHGKSEGIVAIVGITQESSWACKGKEAILCRCAANLFKGKVAKIDFRDGSAIPEGFVLETARGATYIGMPNNWDAEFGTADISWIPMLIKSGNQLLVAVEMCGAGGSNIIARDIYGGKILDGIKK